MAQQTTISGDRIDLSKFRNGWALCPQGKVAHYFSRDAIDFSPACKADMHIWRDSKGFIFFAPGDFSKCKRCLKRVLKEKGLI